MIFIYWEFLKNEFVWVLFCPNLSKNVLPLLSVSALQVYIKNNSALRNCGNASLTPSPLLMFLLVSCFLLFPFSFPTLPILQHLFAPLMLTAPSKSNRSNGVFTSGCEQYDFFHFEPANKTKLHYIEVLHITPLKIDFTLRTQKYL